MSRFHDPNAEVEATALVLSLLPHQNLVTKHFDREQRSFDAAALTAELNWSASERALIDAAAEIWGGSGTLGALIGRVDDVAYRRVLEALELRRGILLDI